MEDKSKLKDCRGNEKELENFTLIVKCNKCQSTNCEISISNNDGVEVDFYCHDCSSVEDVIETY